MSEDEFKAKAKENGLDDDEINEIIEERKLSQYPLPFEVYLENVMFVDNYP